MLCFQVQRDCRRREYGRLLLVLLLLLLFVLQRRRLQRCASSMAVAMNGSALDTETISDACQRICAVASLHGACSARGQAAKLVKSIAGLLTKVVAQRTGSRGLVRSALKGRRRRLRRMKLGRGSMARAGRWRRRP